MVHPSQKRKNQPEGPSGDAETASKKAKESAKVEGSEATDVAQDRANQEAAPEKEADSHLVVDDDDKDEAERRSDDDKLQAAEKKIDEEGADELASAAAEEPADEETDPGKEDGKSQSD